MASEQSEVCLILQQEKACLPQSETRLVEVGFEEVEVGPLGLCQESESGVFVEEPFGRAGADLGFGGGLAEVYFPVRVLEEDVEDSQAGIVECSVHGTFVLCVERLFYKKNVLRPSVLSARVVYTLLSENRRWVAVVLETFLTHKEYEKRFRYC